MIWETWNGISPTCCCSSLTFFSHKFTQHHTFPRNISPWNGPFQWKTASVTISPAIFGCCQQSPMGILRGEMCICLGVQPSFKRWCCRLRIDSMVSNVSPAKNNNSNGRRRRIFPLFFWHCFSTVPGYSENICQHCSPKPEAYAHVVETEVWHLKNQCNPSGIESLNQTSEEIK